MNSKELDEQIKITKEQQEEMYAVIEDCIKYKYSFEAIIEYAVQGLEAEVAEAVYVEMKEAQK